MGFQARSSAIDGLHCRHVGGQNKRKFAHIVCIKMAVNYPRRKILFFLSTNMVAMTSHANPIIRLMLNNIAILTYTIENGEIKALRVVTRYMGSEIKGKKWVEMRDHKPWDRDKGSSFPTENQIS